MVKELILASGSPRRKELLTLAGVPHTVMVSHADETVDVAADTPTTAIQIAVKKARAVKEKAPAHSTILAADTIVTIGGDIIGKPADEAEAIRTLLRLQGNTHTVITGVAILQGSREITFAEVTEVTFHPLSLAQIKFYVTHYQPYDKAGAYAIQEWIGMVGIKKINGDFYNVMGLPVSRVLQTLDTLA